MRRRLARGALVALAVVLAGCGGGAKDRVAPVVESSKSDCDFKQITAGARREGSCVARGVTITVADKANRLRGRDYDTLVLDVRTARALRSRTGAPLRPNGVFVIVKLAVTNTLETPHEFDRASDLVFLFVDGKYFGESPEAAGDPQLAAFRHRRELEPRETAIGTVVFDVPQENAGNLFARGSDLVFVSFADEAKRFPTGSQPLKTLGYVRLWK